VHGEDFVDEGWASAQSARVDPTGKYLFVANQESNNIVVFRIDPRAGD